jgi:hypothetical protein
MVTVVAFAILAGGVYKPLLLTPVPDQVPPEGTPFSCTGAVPAQILLSGPALAASMALMLKLVLAEQPGKLFNEAVSVTL